MILFMGSVFDESIRPTGHKIIKHLGLNTAAINVLQLLRKFRASPMQKVLKELRERGIVLSDLHALEVFGGPGRWVTKYYARYVSTLDIWEIEHKYENRLRRSFPHAEIKITDSYHEIKSTSRKYNLIVVDSPFSVYGERGEYCEHFALFPDLFRIVMDSAILVLNVFTHVTDAALREYPYLFNEKHLARRSSFYKMNHPERLSFDELRGAYKDLALANGFVTEWHFFRERRWASFYFLVLKIKKLNREHNGELTEKKALDVDSIQREQEVIEDNQCSG